MIGSTDVGDVSWVVPTVQARGATYAIGTPGPFLADHRAGQVRPGQEGHGQCRQGDGRRRGRCARRSALIARAKADLKARTDVTPYDCPAAGGREPAAAAAAGRVNGYALT